MAYENIKIDYRDTPEKLREEADKVIAFLTQHLMEMNAIEAECTKLAVYAQKGIRIPKKPKDEKGIWELYKKSCGEALSKFCSEKLLERGYAQSMSYSGINSYDGKNIDKEIHCEYGYLSSGCELAITMKSSKRAIIEISFSGLHPHLSGNHQFTLVYTDQWWLTDKRWKLKKEEKWRRVPM